MKHPTEDHSFFCIDLIDELVEEYLQLYSHSEDIDNFTERTNSIDCLGSISEEEADYAESREVHNLSNSVYNINDIADLDFEAELLEVLDYMCNHENPECSIEAEVQPLPKHLKYAYLDTEQQLSVIIANNLHQEQEDKLLKVLRQHKKEIGWTLSDL
ncbi:hypothetical protein CR513_12611, partial [Mucuna pruriens]